MQLSTTFLFLCILGWEYVDSQVCTKRNQYRESISVPHTIYVKETYYTKCWYSSRCRKTRTAPSTTYVTEYRIATRIALTCCSGYTDETESEDNGIVCTPVCRPPCQNGACVSPGQCVCNVGYVNASLTNDRCVPFCENGCLHGHCAAPNQCECDFGYSLQNESCFPICTEPCVNGICVAPESCECHTGFRKNSENRCDPYCSVGCRNGNCVAPEICNCDNGYILKDGACVPYCSFNCEHGSCIAPDVCECDDGYNTNNHTNTCKPYCSTPCENGECAAPEVCQCNDGYTLQNDTCIPDCKQTCINSSCTEPNTCTCWEGYEQVDNFTCKLNCSKDCTEGLCTVPDGCECDVGYEKVNNICMPICFNCMNGDCKAPDVCKCHEGFKEYNETINDAFHQKCVQLEIAADEYSDIIYTSDTMGTMESNDSEEYWGTSDTVKMYFTTSKTNDISTDYDKNEGTGKVKRSTFPYWMVIIIAFSLVCLTAIVIAIFLKRKRIIQYFSGGSYTVEDAKQEPTTSGQKHEIKLSTLLKKDKEIA